ncbi:MAG: hypothetical protein ACRELT_02765, partial [Longimicrobiales bacterium]
ADIAEEPFAPEPFVDDESLIVAAAFEAEAALPLERSDTDTPDAAGAAGDSMEPRLYDGIAGDEAGDGVPGPIGLGEAEPWSAAPEWSTSDLQLVGDDNDGEEIDLDEDDDEEMQTLLRNAAAAGYDLDADALADELLLDEAIGDDDAEPDTPPNGGWLPTLLEDDK